MISKEARTFFGAPCIIVVAETWFYDCSSAQFVDNYDFITKCRPNRSHREGVGLYVLNNQNTEVRGDLLLFCGKFVF